MLELVLGSLLLGALLVVLVPKRVAPLAALVAVAAAIGFASWNVRQLLLGATVTGLRGALRLDAPGALVLMLVLGLGFMTALVSSQTEAWARRFYALLLTFTATMALASMADNLGLLWASIEATTLSSALLVGHRRTRQSTEAAWKYLILSSTGILFAFVATLVLVLAGRGAGVTTLSWRELLGAADRMDPGMARLAMVLATVGYGTKAGLVPYHFWLPDAHSEAPSPVSALLSGVLLSCALLALDRFARVARFAGVPMENLLLTLGVVSVVVGGALVFAARTYKRMLAYSSVENMGLVAFAFGLGSPLALAGAYLHILSHGVAKSLAFFSAGRIHHHLGTVEIAQARGLLAKSPTAARSLLVGVLALAGLPLLAPFTSKIMILAAALPAVPWPYAVALLAGLAIAFVGFMRQASFMMADEEPAGSSGRGGAFGSSSADPEPRSGTEAKDSVAREPWTVPLALGLLVLANVVLAFAGPSLLRDLLDAVATPGATP